MAEQLQSPVAQPRRSNTLATALLLGVVAFQTVVIGAYGLKGYYFVDDFLHFFFAKGPLTLQYLKEPVFQHLIPGYRLVFWVLHHYFPMSWEAAVAGMLVFHGLSSWVMFRLLLRLCPLPVATVLLLIWAVSPIQLRLTLWAAAGFEYFPCNLFSLLAIERMLAYWSEGRKRDLGWSLLGIVLGLSFFVKAGLVIGYLGLIWLLFAGLRPREQLLKRTLTSLAGVSLIAGLYLFYFIKYYYLPLDMGGAAKPTVPETLLYMWDGLIRVLIPTFAGVKTQYTTEHLILGCVLAAAFVGACLWVRGGWRVLLFFIGSAIPNQAIVAFARLKLLPYDLFLFDLRFYSELAYVFCIALGLLAWLWARQRETAGAPVATAAPVRAQGPRWAAFAAIVVVLCGVRLYYLDKASGPLIYWFNTTPVRTYITNLTAGLDEVRSKHGAKYEEFSFFNHQLPESIMPQWIGMVTSYGEFFQLLDPKVTTDVNAGTMYIIDTSGRIRPARFHAAAEGLLEGGLLCLKGGERATFVLAESVDMKEGIVEVELDQPGEVNGLVMLSEASEFNEGKSWYWTHGAQETTTYVTVKWEKPVKRFQLKLAEGRDPVCVKRARVGHPKLVDETTAFPMVQTQP